MEHCDVYVSNFVFMNILYIPQQVPLVAIIDGKERFG